MNYFKIIQQKNSWILLITFIIIGLLVVPQVAGRYAVTLLTLCMIYSIFAMSLDLLAGYMGHISLGHASFFAMGSYGVAIAVNKLGWEFHMAVLFALILTVLLGLIFRLLVSSISGVPFVLVNLALGQIVWGLAYRWYSVTGGDDGLSISYPVIGGIAIRGDAFYYFTLIILLICVIMLLKLVNSPFGLAIQGIKFSQSRMSALGYNVRLHKYLTYVIAAFFAGIAGVLLVCFNNYVAPTVLAILVSAQAVLMVLVGGPGTLIGPIIGATVIIQLQSLTSYYTERWIIFVG